MKSRKFLKLFSLGMLVFFLCNNLSFALPDDVILYDQMRNKSNPFEMHSFSLGYGSSNSLGYGSSNPNKRPVGISNNYFKYYELKIESPIYKKYVSLGFEYSFINKAMVANEYTFSLKLKAPLHLPVGDVALTNSYRFGLMNSFHHKRDGNNYYRSLGGMGAIVIGIEYFPIRWFGIFAEQSMRYYTMLLNKEDHPKDGVNVPFSFTNYVFVCGIKVTF